MEDRTARVARTRRWALAAFLLLVAPTTACLPGVGSPEFAKGDCVKIVPKLIDSDLVPAPCGDAVGTFDAANRVYVVDSVIADTEGGCPKLRGGCPDSRGS